MNEAPVIEIGYYPEKHAFTVLDPCQVITLEKLFYGRRMNGGLELHPLEVAFILSRQERAIRLQKEVPLKVAVMDMKTKSALSFNDVLCKIAPRIISGPLAKYKVYETIRLSGNMVRPIGFIKIEKPFGRKPQLLTEGQQKHAIPRILKQRPFEILWFEDEKIGLIPDLAIGRALMSRWTGTLRYKMPPTDKIETGLKLDSLEAIFIVKHLKDRLHKTVPIIDVKTGNQLPLNYLINQAKKEWPGRFSDLLRVYEEWVIRGFCPKSAQKFGGLIRCYPPGSSPFAKQRERKHSQYLVNPVKKEDTLTGVDLAALARLSQSVRKSALYAIVDFDPKKDIVPVSCDWAYYPKISAESIIRENIPPQYMVKVYSEHQEIQIQELASLYELSSRIQLPLIISLVSREYSVSNYHIVKLKLGDSKLYSIGLLFYTVEGF